MRRASRAGSKSKSPDRLSLARRTALWSASSMSAGKSFWADFQAKSVQTFVLDVVRGRGADSFYALRSTLFVHREPRLVLVPNHSTRPGGPRAAGQIRDTGSGAWLLDVNSGSLACVSKAPHPRAPSQRGGPHIEGSSLWPHVVDVRGLFHPALDLQRRLNEPLPASAFRFECRFVGARRGARRTLLVTFSSASLEPRNTSFAVTTPGSNRRCTLVAPKSKPTAERERNRPKKPNQARAATHASDPELAH